jgi:ribose transport system permease protein
VGAVIGALVVLILGNVFNLLGVSFFVSLMVKGAIIIALVALDARLRRD